MAEGVVQDQDADVENEDKEQSFISHLVELRERLLKSIVCILAFFLMLFYFANDIYSFLAQPLSKHLPEGASMIATEVASPFLAPFKLTIMVAVTISVPYLFHQGWAFIAPGLYRNERRLVLPLLVSSTLLFYAGILFAYFAVFPLVFGFFTEAAPEGVTVMTDISRYLDFVLKLFLAFGLAFEVPVVVVLLVKLGMMSVERLQALRPYIIVSAFTIGMLLTPPDVISQILLAVPMWILFEVGLLVARRVKPESQAEEDQDATLS